MQWKLASTIFWKCQQTYNNAWTRSCQISPRPKGGVHILMKKINMTPFKANDKLYMKVNGLIKLGAYERTVYRLSTFITTAILKGNGQ